MAATLAPGPVVCYPARVGRSRRICVVAAALAGLVATPGASAADRPVAVSTPDGGQRVITVTADGDLAQRRWDPLAGAWLPSERLGIRGERPLAVSTTAAGLLMLTTFDGAGRAYRRIATGDATFTDPVPVEPPAPAPAGAVTADGAAHSFSRAPDGTIEGADGVAVPGGPVDSDPAALADGGARVSLWAIRGRELVRNQWDGAAWTGWLSWGVPGVVVGLGQDADPRWWNIFTDGHYANLSGVRGSATRNFRMVVDWNAMLDPTSREYARFGRDFQQASERGEEIVVTVRKPLDRTVAPPAPQDYARGVRLLKQFTGHRVAYWGVWNEPNWRVAGEGNLPGYGCAPGDAELLAGYYRELVAVVGAAHVVGPEFIDEPDFMSGRPGCGRVLERYVAAGGGFGAAAAIHLYRSVTHRSPVVLQRYLDALPPATQVWITEAGALISAGSKDANRYRTIATDREQETQVRYLLDDLLGRTGSGRPAQFADRLYYYMLRAPQSPWWDSGLVDVWDGSRPRSAYWVFCAYVGGTCAFL